MWNRESIFLGMDMIRPQVSSKLHTHAETEVCVEVFTALFKNLFDILEFKFE